MVAENVVKALWSLKEAWGRANFMRLWVVQKKRRLKLEIHCYLPQKYNFDVMTLSKFSKDGQHKIASALWLASQVLSLNIADIDYKLMAWSLQMQG